MNSILMKYRRALVDRSSVLQTKSQVNQLIRRWVTEQEKEKLQKPRLKRAYVKKKTFGDSGYLLLVLPATAFGLGCWQVRRREWKLKLIDQLEERTTAEPIEIGEDLSELQSKDMLYRRVKVRGTFDHSKEIYLGPRSNVRKEITGGLMSTNAQTGVNVITPFKLTDRNITVLMNRGWVPISLKKTSARTGGQIEGEVEIVGINRHTEHRPPFMPKDKPGTDMWLQRDVDKMSSFVGTDPIMIDADFDSTQPGGPIGGQTRVSLRNEHAAYIVTWFSLAGFMSWMWFRRYRRPPPPDTIAYLRK